MNQNQIWFNLNTGIYHKLDVDKLSGLKGISQGFLEDTRNLTLRVRQIRGKFSAYLTKNLAISPTISFIRFVQINF
jgi:hypothetical protein